MQHAVVKVFEYLVGHLCHVVRKTTPGNPLGIEVTVVYVEQRLDLDAVGFHGPAHPGKHAEHHVPDGRGTVFLKEGNRTLVKNVGIERRALAEEELTQPCMQI